jgi:hypothetical protein
VKNVTITLDDRSLDEAKKLAASRGKSLSRFIQELVHRALRPQQEPGEDEFFRLIKELKPNSKGWKWNREEIYEGAVKGLS